MTPPLIAIANLKGGVGKSTTTMMIAEGLALLNKAVLVVDLDPQSNVSYMLASKNRVAEIAKGQNHIAAFLEALTADSGGLAFSNYLTRQVSDIRELLEPQSKYVDLVSAVPRLRFVEFDFERKFVANRAHRQEADRYLAGVLREKIGTLSPNYEVVLLDCSPAFSVTTRAALLAADHIISPTIPDFLSVVGLSDFVSYGLKDILKIEGTPRAVVVTKYRKQDELMVREDERLRQNHIVIGPRIPVSSHIVRATERTRIGRTRLVREKYKGGLHTEVENLAKEVWHWVKGERL